jgi:shikimate kinase
MPARARAGGRCIGQNLGSEFIDADLEIQRQEGRLLWQINESEGIDGF